ncbi:hypothetical protein PspLS_05367, partial [Pyricularia sp. CBS 133598]
VCKEALREYTARHDQISRACIKALSSRPEPNVETEPDLNNCDRNDNLINVNPSSDVNRNVSSNPNGPAGPGSITTTTSRSGARADPHGHRADFICINGTSKYYYDVQSLLLIRIPLIPTRLLR